MYIKRLLTSFSIKSFFLFAGIEYAVILPTLWDYLHLNFGASKFFYGLTLSAFSLANFISSPLYGIIFDYTRHTKLIILFANLFEIGESVSMISNSASCLSPTTQIRAHTIFLLLMVSRVYSNPSLKGDYCGQRAKKFYHFIGNFMYFAAQSKYMILASRFLAGIGAGASAVLFGEISRTTTQKERTAAFTVVIAISELGLIVGPALNLFLQHLDYKVGPFVLDKYTSPGALLVVIWTILELIFLFLFFELPPVDDFIKSKYEEHLEHSEPVTDSSDDKENQVDQKHDDAVNQSVEAQNSNCDGSLSASEEHMPLLTSASMKDIQTPAEGRTNVTSPKKFVKRARWLFKEILRQELVYLLAVYFVVLFNQTSIETMVVPILEELLGWSEFETSLFFCGAGVELIISYGVLMLLSKKITDRWLLLIGLIMELLGYTWFEVMVAGASAETSWIHARVLIGSAVCIFGLPFLFVITGSLFSKLLPKHIQGFGQGVQQSTGSVAAILGPLWAGASLHLYYLLLGVPLGILTGLMVLTLDSFSHLKVPSEGSSKT